MALFKTKFHTTMTTTGTHGYWTASTTVVLMLLYPYSEK